MRWAVALQAIPSLLCIVGEWVEGPRKTSLVAAPCGRSIAVLRREGQGAFGYRKLISRMSAATPERLLLHDEGSGTVLTLVLMPLS